MYKLHQYVSNYIVFTVKLSYQSLYVIKDKLLLMFKQRKFYIESVVIRYFGYSNINKIIGFSRLML